MCADFVALSAHRRHPRVTLFQAPSLHGGTSPPAAAATPARRGRARAAPARCPIPPARGHCDAGGASPPAARPRHGCGRPFGAGGGGRGRRSPAARPLQAGRRLPDRRPPPPPGPGRGAAGPWARGVGDGVGEVRRPGLYRLADGSRIADAVTRAGGATRKAELAQVNLAAPLADGEQVVVPARGAAAPAAAGGGDAGAPAAPIQLSTATIEQLDALPGVGPATAQKILDYRTKHGAFSSVDELDAVPGIGPKRLEQLRDLVVP